MDIFTQLVLIIGKLTPNAVEMLGTGFIVSEKGHIATTKHVVGSENKNLVILFPNIKNINEYQDVNKKECNYINVSIEELDPLKDLAIIKAQNLIFNGPIPNIGSFDNDNVGDDLGIFGFPHCVEGRRALTFQKASIGAKVLLESQGIKSKHAVINIQSRPGQSGSLIYSYKNNCISGVLIGAWLPYQAGSGISLAGIDPRELHQTTHCISAEYIKEMI